MWRYCASLYSYVRLTWVSSASSLYVRLTWVGSASSLYVRLTRVSSAFSISYKVFVVEKGQLVSHPGDGRVVRLSSKAFLVT
jgi:hypothetical protein